MGWIGAPNIGEHVPEAEAVVATTIVIVVELDKARGGPTRGATTVVIGIHPFVVGTLTARRRYGVC